MFLVTSKAALMGKTFHPPERIWERKSTSHFLLADLEAMHKQKAMAKAVL